MKKIPVKLGAASYSVLLANGLLRQAGKLIHERCGEPSSCIVITSPRIWGLWGRPLQASLKSAKLSFAILKLPDGELYKNLRSIEKLMTGMAAAGADRNSVVIAFGGGVIGDVTGFAASIYMRGIPVIQIPTTLLAQVDASIGGKTGVNMAAGKNLIGTFHQPKLVLIDPELLGTLPDREFIAGLFEVIKCGIIRDPHLFAIMDRDAKKIVARDPAAVMQAVRASVGVKADVVSRDEREGGTRRILNFGHTIGHALETESGYTRFLHGEAVAWGMIAAAKIGKAIGVTPSNVAQRIEDAVLQYGRLPVVKAKPAEILRLIRSDKKTLRGIPHFVLSASIGKTVISSEVPRKVVLQAVAELHRLSERSSKR